MNEDKLKEITGMKLMMVESIIGYKFPDDFKNYYKSLDDIRVSKIINILGNEKMLRCFFSMDSESKLYIVKYINFDSKYNSVLIPIGEFEFGDLLCFDKNTNYIFIYNHEEDNITKLSDSFDEFNRTFMNNK